MKNISLNRFCLLLTSLIFSFTAMAQNNQWVICQKSGSTTYFMTNQVNASNQFVTANTFDPATCIWTGLYQGKINSGDAYLTYTESTKTITKGTYEGTTGDNQLFCLWDNGKVYYCKNNTAYSTQTNHRYVYRSGNIWKAKQVAPADTATTALARAYNVDIREYQPGINNLTINGPNEIVRSATPYQFSATATYSPQAVTTYTWIDKGQNPNQVHSYKSNPSVTPVEITNFTWSVAANPYGVTIDPTGALSYNPATLPERAIQVAITVTASYNGATASQTYYVTLLAHSVENGVVTLNDLEDHSWSYYQNNGTTIKSLAPRDVQITYLGNGGEVSKYESEHTFVYKKTIEKNDDNKYAYELIPNPFSKRPKRGDTYQGFSAWKLTSVTNGTVKNASGTVYNAPCEIPAETEVYFDPSNEYGMMVTFEAVWAPATVILCSSANDVENALKTLPNQSYERNFIVITGGNFRIPTTANARPATITSISPDGLTDYRSATCYIKGGYISSNNTKFEYININNHIDVELLLMR